MKKIMISQPMRGKTNEEIRRTRSHVSAVLREMGFEIVNTLFDFRYDVVKELGFDNFPLYCLAKSLEEMAACDAVYFCDGWEHTRGCRIEHEAAKAYGLELLYETEPTRETALWIPHSPGDVYMCSNCGHGTLVGAVFLNRERIKGDGRTPLCPYCGKLMRRQKEKE